MLLRTGLRVSEYTSLRADAVVQIGAGPWLHVPVGKLREDRYLPLHPQLVALIDDYRARYVAAGNPLLLPRENGKPADRHAVTRYINKAGAAAGLPHIHPHQLRHTLATQAVNRGMSLEAIAAMLGHRSLDMTLRYAKIGTFFQTSIEFRPALQAQHHDAITKHQDHRGHHRAGNPDPRHRRRRPQSETPARTPRPPHQANQRITLWPRHA
jgi:integrase